MMKRENKSSAWGKGVFILWSGFAVFILSLVVFASQQDFHLVEGDYYEKELQYQRQIDGLDRARQLSREVEVGYDAESEIMTISLPPESFTTGTEGTFRLYRPSNADLDKVFPVKPDAVGQQQHDVGELEKGLWRVYIEWTMNNAEFISRHMLIVE